MLILLFFFIVGYLNIRAELIKSKSPIAKAFGRILVPLLSISAYVYIYKIRGISLLYSLIIVLFFLYAEFIHPLITGRKIKGYKKKLEHQDRIDGTDKSIISKLLRGNSNGDRVLGYAAIFILLISFFFIDIMGGAEARYKTSFLIIKSNPELVILCKYSQKFICAEFDKGKKQVKNIFYIKSIDQIANEKLKIVSEEIGPLKPSKKKY